MVKVFSFFSLQALIQQIKSFGQTPHQILTTPHPSRTQTKVTFKKYNFVNWEGIFCCYLKFELLLSIFERIWHYLANNLTVIKWTYQTSFTALALGLHNSYYLNKCKLTFKKDRLLYKITFSAL